jgi:cell division transport system permease protein
MTTSLLLTLLRHGARNIRYGGLPFFFATLMTSLGLFTLAAFATIVSNFERVSQSVGESIAAVCFLKVDDATDALETRARIAMMSGVRDAKLVSPDEALSRAREALPEASGKALEGAAGVRLPWIVEVTPSVGDVEGAREQLRETLAKDPAIDEIMHPGGEVARVEALMRLLHGAGGFLGVLITLVVLVVVSNSVKLTVFARREEIAIMKLVGATDAFVASPFLLAGLAQGIIGALLSLLTLAVAHASLAGVVRHALSGALGAFVLEPLPWTSALWVLLGGALLGLFGAAISIGRFLRV